VEYTIFNNVAVPKGKEKEFEAATGRSEKTEPTYSSYGDQGKPVYGEKKD